MESIDIKKIKEIIPRGAQAEIAEKAGVSTNCVYNVFKGTSKNRKVFVAIAEYLDSFKKEQEQVQRKIKASLN
jgi:predicted transcriptional regulator